jgi:hypothetical protein
MLDSAGRTRPFSQQLCIWATNVLNNALCGLYRVQVRAADGQRPVRNGRLPAVWLEPWLRMRIWVRVRRGGIVRDGGLVQGIEHNDYLSGRLAVVHYA